MISIHPLFPIYFFSFNGAVEWPICPLPKCIFIGDFHFQNYSLFIYSLSNRKYVWNHFPIPLPNFLNITVAFRALQWIKNTSSSHVQLQHHTSQHTSWTAAQRASRQASIRQEPFGTRQGRVDSDDVIVQLRRWQVA